MIKNARLTIALTFTLTFATTLFLLLAVILLREAANEPQRGLANDTVLALEKGGSTNNLLPDRIIELENGQSIFGVIYDDTLKPISYSATLAGKPPVPPKGVFEQAKNANDNAVIWQVNNEQQSAIVVKRYDGIRKGYVLFGKSFNSTYVTLKRLATIAALGWLAAIVIALGVMHFPSLIGKTKSKPSSKSSAAPKI